MKGDFTNIYTFKRLALFGYMLLTTLDCSNLLRFLLKSALEIHKIPPIESPL